MSVNLDELDPGSPEYEEALMRAQDEEDAANGNDAAQAEGEPDAADAEDGAAQAPPAADDKPAEDETAIGQPTPEKPDTPVAGVLSKDGKRVLSYAVLKSERDAKRLEREARLAAEAERDRVKQELEDLRAGKKAAPANADSLSEEELEELAADFPWAAKLAKEARAARREVEELRARGNAGTKDDDGDADDAPDTGNPIQDAIDATPLLPEWQATDPEKFARAIEIDQALQNSRKWKGKPLEDRFAHVAKQVADEFDIQFPDDSPQPSEKAPSKPDPKTVIERARRATPNTLSDFKGGAADPTDERIDRLPPQKMLDRFAGMSDAEIDAYLAKLG